MTETTLDALLVGAGFAGLHVLHKLRKEGLNAKIFEAGPGIGGTWYWNRYPGARTDSIHTVYQFTQDDIYKGFKFSERFAGQKQLLAYFRHVDEKLNLSRDIQFNTRVISAEFSTSRSQWHVKSDDGKFTWARHLVLCTGFAEREYTPPFDGLDNFNGKLFHASRWPESVVEMKGKRVAVIGTGATGVQIIQEIAGDVSYLAVYQRTPNLALPMQQSTIQDQSKWKFPQEDEYPTLFSKVRETFFGLDMCSAKQNAMDATPEERRILYEDLYKLGGFAFILGNYQDVITNQEANNEAYSFWCEKTRVRINDPVKQEILAPKTPPHPIFAKRPSLEQNYYDVFNQSNVDIINVRQSPIVKITKAGIQTVNEGEIDFDIIIFATGFDSVTGGILNIHINNGANETIQDKWKPGTWTNLGMTTAGFPNMYFLYGPQAPTAFSNGPTCIEVQGDWIAELIAYMRAENKTSVVATKAAEDSWKKSVNDAWNATLFPAADGWYNGANIPGKPVEPLNYIGGIPAYIAALDASSKNNYEGFVLT